MPVFVGITRTFVLFYAVKSGLDKNRDYSFNEDGSNHIPKYNIQVPILT